jgi:hypothetical protein
VALLFVNIGLLALAILAQSAVDRRSHANLQQGRADASGR